MEPLTVTNKQLLALHRGLSSLDGAREGTEGLLAFDFSRDVRWRLVCAAIEVEKAKIPYDRMDRLACAKYGITQQMEVNDANSAKLLSYSCDMADALDQQVTIDDMPRFTLAELLDRPLSEDKKARKTNAIPQSVLHNLAPILAEK